MSVSIAEELILIYEIQVLSRSNGNDLLVKKIVPDFTSNDSVVEVNLDMDVD